MRFILMVRSARRIMLLVGIDSSFTVHVNMCRILLRFQKTVAYSNRILKSVTRYQRRMLHDSKIET